MKCRRKGFLQLQKESVKALKTKPKREWRG